MVVVSAAPPPRRVTGALLEEVLPGLVAGCGSSSEEGRRCRESLEVLREVEELRQERGGGGTSYTPSSSPPLQQPQGTGGSACGLSLPPSLPHTHSPRLISTHGVRFGCRETHALYPTPPPAPYTQIKPPCPPRPPQ